MFIIPLSPCIVCTYNIILTTFVFRIEQTDKKSSGDSTHSVVAFLAVAFVMLTTVGLMVSSGTFFPYILEEFQESRASTAAIQSIFYGVGMGTGKVCCYFERASHTGLTPSKHGHWYIFYYMDRVKQSTIPDY